MLRLLKYLAVAWLVWQVIKYLIRFFFTKKMEEIIKNQQEYQREQQRPNYPEGSIHIDSAPSSSRNKNSNNDGEYVDYEEVK